jgi:diguanylate cyclase
MPLAVKRCLQIAVILGIATSGALCFIQAAPNSLPQYYLLALIAFAVAGVSLSEIKTPAQNGTAKSAGSDVSPHKADSREKKFEGTVKFIMKIVQSSLDDNKKYSASLHRANQKLPTLESPDAVHAAIALLIDENEQMQSKMNSLSRGLDAARSQVANLHLNLLEANEIGLRDPLTALGNRRFFDDKLTSAISQSRAESVKMCLVLIDLDEFKKINDRFGHPVGDMVLRLFSELLTANVKGRDTAARFGGDEFAIIFSQTTLDQARLVVDQVRRQLEAKRWIVKANNQQLGKVTASFGVAQLRGVETAEELFLRADRKLYEAKAEGRNRIAYDVAA